MANGISILINATNQASKSIEQVKKDVEGLGKAGKNGESGLKSFGSALSGAWKAAFSATAAIAAVGGAIKVAYDAAKDAASLEYAETRFSNLAKSIGTTADVLLNDMREATSGMMSDAELVASGADLMALGLAKTHEEAIRLSSVAGQLGMNMNQLVLTLTNKTTMRFDALGVSVDGFTEKVKTLEAAGLSADDAFKEAFLQQAEEQILKVGSAADSSIGAFQRMEAAQANYFNQLKQDLVEAGTWWANYWENYYNDRISEKAYKTLIEHAKTLGIDTTAVDQAVRASDDYYRVTAIGIDQNKALIDGLSEQVSTQEEMNAMRWRGTNANYEYSASEKLVAAEIANVRSEFQQQADKITTLDSTYKGIIDLAYKYTDMLEEKETLQIERQKLINQGWSEQSNKVKDLDAKILGLDDAMAGLADRVTLDMFMATIAIGGVTEAELAAYMQMAIDMGLMSEEGAQAAIDAYGNAIATINGYEIDEKTGNVNIDAVAAFLTLDLLQAYALKDKEAKAIFKVQYEYGLPGDNYWEDKAAGGEVRAAAAGVAASLPYYWVGERGPEPFFPSVDGRIVSNTQAMSALRGGAGADSGESIVVNINTPMNFADKAWVERTLAPYIQKGIREAAIRG